MGTGIMICGLNGAGKSTLGKALAEKLGFYFIDAEDLYFPGASADDTYAFPRTREEAEKLLAHQIHAHGHFVLASVKGDYGESIVPFFRCAVWIAAPKEIRVQRVKNRSFQKFGGRMLPGGDLHEREEAFFAFVESRADDTAEKWAQSLRCPVIRVDGTKPIAENVSLILEKMRSVPFPDCSN